MSSATGRVSVVLAVGVLWGSAGLARAQQVAEAEALPNAPSAVLAGAQSAASGSVVSGTVEDVDGAEIPGAQVRVENTATHAVRTAAADQDGFFRLSEVSPGSYAVTITAGGFAPWTSRLTVGSDGAPEEIAAIAMRVAEVNTSVQAVFSVHEIADDQVRAEEKQKIAGFIPNFYVVYDWHAAPLSPGQKFHLALRSEIDPVTILSAPFFAAIEQADNALPGYGQGAAGYGKRVAASYADGFSGTLFGGAVYPSLFHQDPRYYYKGTGSILSRALYAISTVVICRGDNGHWQFNISSILGDLTAASISESYYPASNRNGAGLLIGNSLLGTGLGAISSLFEEFVLRRVTPGLPPAQPAPPTNQAIPTGASAPTPPSGP